MTSEPPLVPPPGDLPPGPVLVDRLDPELPLVLLPVRLATRFHRGDGPAAPPTELWVRIFPDALHADAHVAALSTEEVALGRAYWERLWRAAGRRRVRDDTHRWLVSQLGAPRAAWVARRTQPTNPEDAPDGPVPRGEPLVPAPAFGDLGDPPAPRATLARGLPDRWLVRIVQGQDTITDVWSAPVRRPLAMAPNVADLPEGGGLRELLQAQDLWWMADFDEAVAAGMGVRLTLDSRQTVDELLVLGVRDRNPGAAAELAGLLDAHRFSTGLEIVPHGTPTNSTGTVDAGFTDVPADLAAYLDRQLGDPVVERPELRDPAVLLTTSAADALALALGLDGATAFDVAEHAGDRTGDRAEAMNRALWPATWGHVLRTMLGSAGAPLLAPEDFDWMRGWFCDWVRAAGPLPLIRAGDQPYGLLPVTVLPINVELPATRLGELQTVLRTLRDDWLDSRRRVPGYSVPDPRPSPEREAVAIASVLGAVPHPTAFRVRRAIDRFEDSAGRYEEGLTELEALFDETTAIIRAEYDNREPVIRGGTIDEQHRDLANLVSAADAHELLRPEFADELEAIRNHIKTVLLPDVARHNVRSETLGLSDRFSGATLPDPDDPPLWYVEYGNDGAAPDGTFPALALVPRGGTEGDPARVAESLRSLAADARLVAIGDRPAYDHGIPRPLFRVLAEHGIEQVAVPQAEAMALGFDRLATLFESGAVADPFSELELLLRETLGLATHRIDAWMTSVASNRLAELRAERPTGVQLGGYGWVVELSADDAGPDTHGFVHAPSLDHAATAAVLRSAWLAHRDGSEDAAFAVDLSSDRVRRAAWLLEGVRNGVDLAELLGARFERRLHDAGLDDLVADVRERVLAEAGHPGRPANAIVDGLALATAYRSDAGADGEGLRARIDRLRTGLDGFPDDGLGRTLLETVADLDATADALTAESVHALVKGNLAQAGAALAASGSGDAGIPELRMAGVHREAQNVSHRVALVLGAARPAAASALAVAEPALAAWLGARLAGLALTGVAERPVTLAGLGLGGAEAVALAATGGELEANRLVSVVRALAARAGAPAAADPGAPRVTLQELAVVAGALHTALGQARALRGEDLARAVDGAPVLDVAELDARRLALAGRLERLAAAPADDATLAARAADLAAVDDAGLVLALGARPAERPALVAALLARAAERAAALRAPLPDDWDALEGPARVEHLTTRIAGALALKLPVLPRFTPANAAELTASARRSDRRLGARTAAPAWLLQAGRVHAGAGRIEEALGLLAAVRGGPVAAEQVVQLPDRAEDPWVAVDRPASPGPRTCVLSLSDLGAAVAAGPVSGVLFDAWTEPVPEPASTTGVAVHFDSPGAQPPQAVLLATLAPGEEWTVDGLRTLITQTRELGEIRAVGPEHLRPWGHSLPAIFLPEDAAVATAEDPE